MRITLGVDARRLWNDTGLHVAAGQRLRVVASGRWRDWTIETDADGFSRAHLKLAESLRRAPMARWFQLCGAVDRRLDQVIVLGQDVAFTAPASGRLCLFANDVSWMHWNNSGRITAQILTDDGASPGTDRPGTLADTATPPTPGQETTR